MNRKQELNQLHPDIFLSNLTDDDCGVVAIQTVTGVDRNTALEVARSVGKYKEERGMFAVGVIESIYKITGRNPSGVPFEDGETVGTFASKCSLGVYIIFTADHVCVVKDGDLYNAGPVSWSRRLVAVYHAD